MIALSESKSVTASELAALLEAAGWGEAYDLPRLATSIAAHSYTAIARNADGELVGYLSAFSDGAFTTILNELIVHPQWQRQGVGRLLVEALERRFADWPVQVSALGDAAGFFEALGYRASRMTMTALFKNNSAKNNPA